MLCLILDGLEVFAFAPPRTLLQSALLMVISDVDLFFLLSLGLSESAMETRILVAF